MQPKTIDMNQKENEYHNKHMSQYINMNPANVCEPPWLCKPYKERELTQGCNPLQTYEPVVNENHINTVNQTLSTNPYKDCESL